MIVDQLQVWLRGNLHEGVLLSRFWRSEDVSCSAETKKTKK